MLFCQGDLRRQLRELESKVREEVGNIPMDRFRNSTDDELIEDLCSSLRVGPIVLNAPNDPQINWQDQNVPPAIEVITEIPFEGPRWIFRYRTYPISIMYHPCADVQENSLKFTYNIPIGEGVESYYDKFSRDLQIISDHVNHANGEIEQHNQRICNSVREQVVRRRYELNQLQDIEDGINGV